MALGFGFNKAKILGAAEKFVQQGKLQNAIAEYEKIIKEDPKDLTVLNAIGDLYARVGQNDKAGEYFKKVGDQYASNGFTVKAIAVYKKLSRVSTTSDSAIKLAELYTQQGLFNDARSNYMQVADQLLKAGDNSQAAKVFQKILELDPENTATQSKLADLFIKLGKADEALAIYQSAAESLYARKAFDAADEALRRVLSLNPDNQKALLLRGMISADSGDSVGAMQYLDQVADLDSRPDALRALLHAKLQSNAVEGTEALALKLFTVHQDIGGIGALAEWQATHHREEEALKLYDQYADRFFAHGPASLVKTLYPLISRIRSNPPALERMLRLLQKAGDTSHVPEVMELLAHANVQGGNLQLARDLYKELSELEPENPLHMQNYKQMLSRLGEDAVSRPLTEEESGQAFMVEELEHTATMVQQEYTPSVERAIQASLTDAELFISYNVPLKAIAPLEAVLPLAPRDARLNQRLASLYLRAGRYSDGVRVCKLLSDVYAGFGRQAEADLYAEEAQKYSARAHAEPAQSNQVAPPSAAQHPIAEPEPQAPDPALAAPVVPDATIQEFVLDVPGEIFESAMEPAPAEASPIPSEPTVFLEPAVPEFTVEAPADLPGETPAAAGSHAVEIDVSNEWEDMLTVESAPLMDSAGSQTTPLPDFPIPEPRVEAGPAADQTIIVEVARPPKREPMVAQPLEAAIQPLSPPAVDEPTSPPTLEFTVVQPEPEPEPPAPVPDPTLVDDKIQEIQFYISQGFWDMAWAAMHDLGEIAPDNPVLDELKAAIAAGEIQASAAAKPTAITPPVPSSPVVAPVVPVSVASTPVILAPAVSAPAAASPVVPAAVMPSVPVPAVATPIISTPPAPAIEKHIPIPVPLTTTVASPPTPAPIATAQPIQSEPGPAAIHASPRIPAPVQFEATNVAQDTVLDLDDEMVLELDEELSPAVSSKPEVSAAGAEPLPKPTVAPSSKPAKTAEEDVLGSLVSDLEQSLGDFIPGSTRPAEPEEVEVTVEAAPEPPPPVVHAAPVAVAETNGALHNPEAASVLSDILSDLQHDLEDDAAEEQEDPETHYNLGIAFKEMGLLDEAIGELQKVCHAVEVGNSFSQPIQAYTWLAQCLVDKGVPEAAVRWYQKALLLPGLDHGSRCAIYYDLGSAFEASGDKKSALSNFMEVYGSNIDFRDVASRIKVLKS